MWPGSFQKSGKPVRNSTQTHNGVHESLLDVPTSSSARMQSGKRKATARCPMTSFALRPCVCVCVCARLAALLQLCTSSASVELSIGEELVPLFGAPCIVWRLPDIHDPGSVRRLRCSYGLKGLPLASVDEEFPTGPDHHPAVSIGTNYSCCWMLLLLTIRTEDALECVASSLSAPVGGISLAGEKRVAETETG